MSNRVLGHSVYFKVLAEVEREIAEQGDYVSYTHRIIDQLRQLIDFPGIFAGPSPTHSQHHLAPTSTPTARPASLYKSHVVVSL